METYNVNWDLDSTLSSYKERIVDCYENTIIDKLSDCDNLTFLGWASASGNNIREAVFQIKNYDTLYLRICTDNASNQSSSTITVQPVIRLNTSSSLSINNTYISLNWGGSGSTLVSAGGLNAQFNFWMVTKDKANNKKDLQVLWQTKAPTATHIASQGIILGTSQEGHDYVGIFSNGNTNVIYIYFLDDANLTTYYVPLDATGYTDNTRVIKLNWLPITSTGSITTTIDVCDIDFVRIYNTNLGAIEATGYTKDSGEIRKLIQIGNDYYRQIVTSYWVKDPKGDETPVTITNIT